MGVLPARVSLNVSTLRNLHRYAMDYSKLKGELGWDPSESLESGLRKTVSWYLQNQAWVKRVKSGEYQTWVRKHYGEWAGSGVGVQVSGPPVAALAVSLIERETLKRRLSNSMS